MGVEIGAIGSSATTVASGNSGSGAQTAIIEKQIADLQKQLAQVQKGQSKDAAQQAQLMSKKFRRSRPSWSR